MDTNLLIDDISIQGFHIIDNFLELEHCRALRYFADDIHIQGLFKLAKIGSQVQAQENSTIRTDAICWLEEEWNEPSIHAYLSKSLNIAHILNKNLFLGLAEFETHFAIYQPGSFYKKHVDQFAHKKTRKISCVYYINQDWRNHFGGELKLYDINHQFLKMVTPLENRFICFNSELPHEVCTTNHPRYSIAGWMKTR